MSYDDSGCWQGWLAWILLCMKADALSAAGGVGKAK